MARAGSWDAELYEARHSFVFKFGEDLIELLEPKPGERILDLGCGPGQLTARIAEHGAEVLGLDASPEMIGQARQNYPKLKFVLQDAARMSFHNEFDAVFSNAALHWMLEMSAVAACMARALRGGGRLVAELGGKGNIQNIEAAVKRVLSRGGHAIPPSRTVFPSIGEYASILEAQGLEVHSTVLFDRPTLLEGEAGLENWLRQFSWYHFEALPGSERSDTVKQVVQELRPLLFRDGNWYGDYRRLRVIASKPR